MALTVGTSAPAFYGSGYGGKVDFIIKLGRSNSGFIYFYPKDDTPGCTKEACSFRDNYDAYKGKDITVLGVSAVRPALAPAIYSKVQSPVSAFGGYGSFNYQSL